MNQEGKVAIASTKILKFNLDTNTILLPQPIFLQVFYSCKICGYKGYRSKRLG